MDSNTNPLYEQKPQQNNEAKVGRIVHQGKQKLAFMSNFCLQ